MKRALTITFLCTLFLMTGCMKDVDIFALAQEQPTTITYTVTAQANNNQYGTVTITPNKEAYTAGETVVLNAVANSGYKFIKWSDNVIEAKRSIVIANENVNLTANFEKLPQSSYTITFNGSSWNAANWVVYDFTSDGYVTIFGFKTANSQEDVYVSGWLECVVGNYNYETSQGDYMEYKNPNFTWVDNFNLVGQGTGVTYYLYQVIKTSFQEQIVAIDLNARTLTANWSEDCYDIEYYVLHGGDYGTLYPLKGVIQNISWEWATSKKDATKAKKKDDGKITLREYKK